MFKKNIEYVCIFQHLLFIFNKRHVKCRKSCQIARVNSKPETD